MNRERVTGARTDFGAQLRQLRERAGLSQGALARAVGVCRNTIVGIETGQRDPNWAVVLAICAALRVSPGAFMSQQEGQAILGNTE